MNVLAFLYLLLFVASWSMVFGAKGESSSIAVNLGAACMVVGIVLSLAVIL